MAILVGHGTLVTAGSVSLALLRAQCFEHRARKAWEVRAMGVPGVPFPEHHAERVATVLTWLTIGGRARQRVCDLRVC
jgi:hypothetical protein